MKWSLSKITTSFAGIRVGLARPHIATPMPSLVRGKRTARLEPNARRVINMLSVFSARKKQPRRLKLVKEDLVRHQVIQAAWRLFLRDEKAERDSRLEGQYNKIQEACEELEKIDAGLFAKATEREKGKRFSPELRIPTDTPPREPWHFDWKKPEA